MYIVFKELRLIFPEEFVVTIHECTCKKEVPILRSQAEGLYALFARAQVHCDNKARHTRFIPVYNTTFLMSHRECQYTVHTRRIWARSESPSHAFPIFYSRAAQSQREFSPLLTVAVVRVLGARELPLGTNHICVFERGTIFLSRWNMFTINLQALLKVMLSILGHWMSLKWCQWLAWRFGDTRPPSLHSRLLDAGHI